MTDERSSQEHGSPLNEVTRELFLAWRSPRVGTSNPERMTNPVWAWLAREKLSAYTANKQFNGPSSMAAGPCYCVNRFGQSETTLADGRIVAIAGEHEDHYDPDFYIYNDVIVTDAFGNVEIYGYPHEIFPPTDFHSATLVGNRIVMIGCLGHPAQRNPNATPVSALDTGTMAITPMVTSGDLPGWIFKHRAELSVDQRTITIREGERVTIVGGEQVIRENIDDWSLDLERLTWTRLTDRRWQVWELMRADRQCHHLWEISCMAWHVGGRTPYDREQFDKQEKGLGWRPDFEVYAARYSPPIAHTKLEPDEDRYNITSIVIDGVTVQYLEDMHHVRITIRGALPDETIAALVEDARRKLEAVEQFPFEARALPL